MTLRLRHLRAAVSALALAAAGPAIATLVLPPALHAAQAQDASISVAFQNELQPYGDWVTVRDYGRVWRPHGMPANWRPYTRGHWEYTDDYGWYWNSDEKWGWIAFHYGRWALVDNGWVWIPGAVWAPAWVSWRTAEGSGRPDYVGWAPLPPQGVSIEVYQREPRYWTFVKPAEIVAPDIARVVVSFNDYPRIIQRTTIIDRTVLVDNGGFNRGIRVDRVREVVGHPIRTVRVQPRRFDVQVAVRKHHLDPSVVRAFDQRRDREVTRIRDEGFAHKNRAEVENRKEPINVQHWQQARQKAERNTGPNNQAAGANQPGNGRNANERERGNANAQQNNGKAGAAERNANREENGRGGKNARNAEENKGKTGASERNANREESRPGRNARNAEENNKGKAGAREGNANREGKTGASERNANGGENRPGANARRTEENAGKGGAAERNANRREQGGRSGAATERGNANRQNANGAQQHRGEAASERRERNGAATRPGTAGGGGAAARQEHRGSAERNGAERNGRAAAESGGRGGAQAGGGAERRRNQEQ